MYNRVRLIEMQLNVTGHGNCFRLLLYVHKGKRLTAQLGTDSIPADLNPPKPCDDAGLCWSFGSLASIQLTPSASDPGRCFRLVWNTILPGLKVGRPIIRYGVSIHYTHDRINSVSFRMPNKFTAHNLRKFALAAALS